ncbi:MAG: Asp-tRNA(Asn)/Glu-tRNA(Gln) amidotransferase subunit GatB [Candidatus Saccharimonadales bacterium]
MTMIDPNIREQYTVTIGIECHVQLKTRTKLFSAVSNDARDALPNTLISHIDLGLPGALPVLNDQAIELGIRAAFALETEPQRFSKFDRKHYFYPDLPMGYQITQFYHPIIKGGSVKFYVEGVEKIVRIHEAHLEADAGKSTHPAGKNYSLVDYNRAGTPLLEIVSEPDMHTASEAKAYARELYLRMRYADVSDANLFYGNMRFDVNVSVSKSTVLGTRTETKNLNSFKSVEKSIEHEIDRQIALLEKNIAIVQETRGWDDAKQKTFSQRTKEEAQDYRYMPDPDLPPIQIAEDRIANIRQNLPITPTFLREKLVGLGLDISTIETLIEEMPAGNCIHTLIKLNCAATIIARIANWMTSEVQALVSENKVTWDSAKLDPTEFIALAQMAIDNQISSTGAKVVLAQLVIHGGKAEQIAQTHNVLQVSDETIIATIVAEVLQANNQAVEDVKNGEAKAIGYLVGQVMKQSHGKANPQLAQSLIRKQLES